MDMTLKAADTARKGRKPPPFLPLLKGVGTAAATFGLLGTVAALWDNPLFVRMTPAGMPEIALLAAQSLLLGLYVALPRPVCAPRGAGTGSVLAFLGIACPICNKLLLYVLGAEFLLGYFEPVRIYIAALGVAITAFAVWTKMANRLGAQAEGHAA